jgi:anaerobic carbon-monoxide dehydrogenase iron sulfur subunit
VVHYITFDKDKCVLCDMCLGVCSLNKLEQIKPAAACIHISRDPLVSFGKPTCTVCDMTHERACVDSCPTEALEYDETSGVVRFDAGLCTMCENCVDACPNVGIDREAEKIMICDLCGGDPLCVKWCPEGALAWGGVS